jgi:hypothetical protein
VASILLREEPNLTLAVGSKFYLYEQKYLWGDFAAAAVLTLNGGTLSLFQPTTPANLTNTATTLTMNAGGMVRLQDGGTSSFTRLTLTNLNRANQGVLTVFDVNGRLGTSELLTSTNIFGVAAASAVTNGILAPSLVEVGTENVAKFVTASSGSLVAYSGATVASLAGLQPIAIADLTAAQTLTGLNSIYALRTASNISGGTLRVQSVSNANMGALLLNSNAGVAPTVSSNLIFGDSTQSSTGGGAASGEALVYVSGGTATLSGNVWRTTSPSSAPAIWLSPVQTSSSATSPCSRGPSPSRAVLSSPPSPRHWCSTTPG